MKLYRLQVWMTTTPSPLDEDEYFETEWERRNYLKDLYLRLGELIRDYKYSEIEI